MRNLQLADEASAETSSPQLGTLVSWLWKKLMCDLRLSLCLLNGEEMMAVAVENSPRTFPHTKMYRHAQKSNHSKQRDLTWTSERETAGERDSTLI